MFRLNNGDDNDDFEYGDGGGNRDGDNDRVGDSNSDD